MLRKLVLSVKEVDKSDRTEFVTYCAHETHASVGELLSCAISNCPNPSWKNAVVELDRGTPDIVASENSDRCFGGEYARLKSPVERENYWFTLRMPSDEHERPSLSDVPELPQLDLTINVGREEIRSNSSYLSAHSKYFADVIAENGVIDVGDLNSSEFAEFLLAIYPQQRSITASNVTFLVKLARVFDAPVLTERCVKFLTSDTKMDLFDKILLADQSNLHDARKQLIFGMTSSDHRTITKIAFLSDDAVSSACKAEVFKQSARLLHEKASRIEPSATVSYNSRTSVNKREPVKSMTKPSIVVQASAPYTAEQQRQAVVRSGSSSDEMFAAAFADKLTKLANIENDVDLGDYYVKRTDVLGSGGFGTVYRGIKKEDNSDVAVKEMYVLGPEYEVVAASEISTLSKLSTKSANVVQLFAHYRFANVFYFVMELCSELNLKDVFRIIEKIGSGEIDRMNCSYIETTLGNVVDDFCSCIARTDNSHHHHHNHQSPAHQHYRQPHHFLNGPSWPNGAFTLFILDCVKGIAKGLRSIHTEGIIHGDLKPDNVLVCLHPKKDSTFTPVTTRHLQQIYFFHGIKVTDFGLAKQCTEDPSPPSRRHLMTRAEKHAENLAFKTDSSAFATLLNDALSLHRSWSKRREVNLRQRGHYRTPYLTPDELPSASLTKAPENLHECKLASEFILASSQKHLAYLRELVKSGREEGQINLDGVTSTVDALVGRWRHLWNRSLFFRQPGADYAGELRQIGGIVNLFSYDTFVDLFCEEAFLSPDLQPCRQFHRSFATSSPLHCTRHNRPFLQRFL